METWTDLTHTAEHRFGVVTRDELLAAGLADRTIDAWSAGGRLVPLARGVYRLAGVPPSFAAEVMAAILVFPGTPGRRATARRGCWVRRCGAANGASSWSVPSS